MTTSWYYAKSGQEFGPVSFPELQHLTESGQLAPSDYVLPVGAQEWLVAATIDGLFLLPTNSEKDSQPRWARDYWLFEDGKVHGPISVDKLRTAIMNRSISPDVLACSGIGSRWFPLSRILELHSHGEQPVGTDPKEAIDEAENQELARTEVLNVSNGGNETLHDSLVPCEKCQARISDVADACPRCGHPQPMAMVKAGAESGHCKFCKTFNSVGMEQYMPWLRPVAQGNE
jgi:hypothetical protein